MFVIKAMVALKFLLHSTDVPKLHARLEAGAYRAPKLYRGAQVIMCVVLFSRYYLLCYLPLFLCN